MSLSGGGFAEYIRVMDWIAASSGVVRIPDGVPFEQAAFVEPVNTVLKGVKMLNLAPDDTVLVIGQGPIGLMHAALSRRSGAGAYLRSLPRAPCRLQPNSGYSIQSMQRAKTCSSACLPETDGRGADAVILAVGGTALFEPQWMQQDPAAR